MTDCKEQARNLYKAGRIVRENLPTAQQSADRLKHGLSLIRPAYEASLKIEKELMQARRERNRKMIPLICYMLGSLCFFVGSAYSAYQML